MFSQQLEANKTKLIEVWEGQHFACTVYTFQTNWFHEIHYQKRLKNILTWYPRTPRLNPHKHTHNYFPSCLCVVYAICYIECGTRGMYRYTQRDKAGMHINRHSIEKVPWAHLFLCVRLEPTSIALSAYSQLATGRDRQIKRIQVYLLIPVAF